MPSCPENTIGLLLYRLVITNAIIINGCDVGRGLILKHCSEQAYDPPDVSKQVFVDCRYTINGCPMVACHVGRSKCCRQSSGHLCPSHQLTSCAL